MKKNIQISWEDYYRARNVMFESLEKYIQENSLEIEKIITIPCGGMLVAGHTSKFLGKIPIETINISSYTHGQRSEIKILDIKNPLLEMSSEEQKKCLVVDDLADSGETLKWVREKLPNVTIVVPWVRWEKEIGKIVDVYGTEIGHDTFLDFPWEVDYVQEGNNFDQQSDIVKKKLRI